MRHTTGRAHFSGYTMAHELRHPRTLLRFAAHDLSWVDEAYKADFIRTDTTDDADVAGLQGVGASLWRDSADQRIIDDVLNGTGQIISSESEVGGWPDLPSEAPRTDSDGDGMPDDWEIVRRLDPHDPEDGSRDLDGNGYTELVVWLIALVD